MFPIDLKCESDSENGNQISSVAETEWKHKAKSSLGGNLLLAFAYGFPDIGSNITVKYRLNKIMQDQLTRNIEVDDENEGVDDTDD